MEIFYYLSLFLLIFFTSLLFFNFINGPQKHHKPNDDKLPLPLPPGTTGWPLLGETLDYLSKAQLGTLREFVAERTAKYSSKVFKTSLIGHPMVILPGPEGNKFIFSNEEKLVRNWYPESMDKIFPKSHNKSNREEFSRVRKMLPSFLKGEALKRLLTQMDAVMKQHLQTHWVAEQERDKLVHVIVRDYTLTMACKLFLSMDDALTVRELTKHIEVIRVGMQSIPINFPGTAFRAAIKASEMICEKVKVLVKQRRIDISEKRVSSSQDMLSTLIVASAGEEGKFYDDFDIASHLVGLMVAGYSTVNDALTFIIKCLAELPDVYSKVHREQMEIKNSKEPKELLTWEDMRKMSYTWNVCSESMRLQPNTIGTFRVAISDFTYAGYFIPKGWKLHWMMHATHKNPEYFPDPDRFDPSRFEGSGPLPYTFVPFGGGPRMCPGNEYARLAILVFMHNLVTNFRWEKVIGNEKDLSGFDLLADHGLLIRLHPHNT